MYRSALLLLLLFCGQAKVGSVRLVELRGPGHEREGGTALLGCQFDLEGEELYSVKWYKGNQEFYRFIPKNIPPILAFNTTPGVHVNMTRSSSTVVVLENLSRDSEGDYICEVSGEAPSFTTVKSSKHIDIHLLPDSGPRVTGLKDQYFLDDEAVVNCTLAASRPRAVLQWLVNDNLVPPQDLRGPWYRALETRPDAEETVLQLRFIVEPKHFIYGAMRLKCQATIAPLYQRETNSTHYIGLPFTLMSENKPFQDSALEAEQAVDSSTEQAIAIQNLFIVLQLILLVF